MKIDSQTVTVSSKSLKLQLQQISLLTYHHYGDFKTLKYNKLKSFWTKESECSSVFCLMYELNNKQLSGKCRRRWRRNTKISTNAIFKNLPCLRLCSNIFQTQSSGLRFMVKKKKTKHSKLNANYENLLLKYWMLQAAFAA